MRLDNLARLIGAKFLTSPTILELKNYVFSLEKIIYGSVYIMENFNLQDIQKASTLGAYAVILEEDLDLASLNPNLYKELTILQVDNIKTCILRLLRYELTLKNSKLIFSDLLTIKIIKEIAKQRFEILKGSLSEVFLKVFNQGENSLFLTYNASLIEELRYGYEIVEEVAFKIVAQSSLFASSLIIKDKFITFPNFPLLFLPQLSKALNFCMKNNILCDLNEIKQLKHFSVIFIDEDFNQRSFGSTNKLLIIEKDEKLFLEEAEFLKNKFNKNFKSSSLENAKVESDIKVKSLEEIKEIKDYFYLLILAQREDILKILNQKKEEARLF